MSIGNPLAPRFLRHLPEPVRRQMAALSDLEGQLEEVLSTVRKAWPDISVEPDVFLEFLARRVPEPVDMQAFAGALNLPDLYLACACLENDPKAVRVFKTDFFPEIRVALAGLNQGPDLADVVEQMVYQKLFVTEPKVRAAINKYAGRGDLRRWLQVTALRTALDLMRSGKKETAVTSRLHDDYPDKAEDPEIAYLKQLYSSQFKTAFGQALAGLSQKERNLLRYYHLEGLTLGEIAGLYRVHEATVSRWLARIRENLLTRTRRRLADVLKVDSVEVDSIIRLIESQMEVSIRHFFNEQALPGSRRSRG